MRKVNILNCYCFKVSFDQLFTLNYIVDRINENNCSALIFYKRDDDLPFPLEYAYVIVYQCFNRQAYDIYASCGGRDMFVADSRLVEVLLKLSDVVPSNSDYTVNMVDINIVEL